MVRKNFLRWLVIFLSMVGTFVFCFQFGFLNILYIQDWTKISFLILFILFLLSIKIGYCILRLDVVEPPSDDALKDAVSVRDWGWFTSDIFLSLGMIGTVIGFIILLIGFGTIDLSSIVEMKRVMVNLGGGMSTALLTTLMGLVGSVLIRLQTFLLDMTIRRFRE